MIKNVAAQLQSTKLASGERVGVIIVGITSTISVISIVFLLVRVILAAVRPMMQGWRGRRDSREAVFFQTQLGTYAACLVLANLLAGLSGVIEFSWLARGRITTGTLCNTQGTLMQVGDFAGSYFTAIIALHTFQSLVMQKKYPTWVNILLIAVGWGGGVALGTASTMVANSRHGPYFNSLGIWCAISSSYTIEQFSIYYLPIIVSALVTSILYALIYLCLRGTLVIGDGIKIHLSEENVRGWAGRLNGKEEYRHFLGSIIKSMLWFPFAFITLFMPITITGLMAISGESVSISLLSFSGVCASLNGFANVLIIYNTLRILKPAFSSPTSTNVGAESFFTPEDRKPSRTDTAPRPILHGKAFPPPISRVGSPSIMGDTYEYPTPPRSDSMRGTEGDVEQAQPWLRHARSNSSVNSMTYLLDGQRELTAHTRNLSNSSALSAMAVGRPIAPHQELIKATGGEHGDLGLQVVSPRTPGTSMSESSGLPAPPRPSRTVTLRESLLSKFDVPQPNEQFDSQHEFVDVSLKSPDLSQAVSPNVTQYSRSIYEPGHYRDTMMPEHEHYEIHRVDSRQTVRPALDAVAQLTLPPRRRPVRYDGLGNESASSTATTEEFSSSDSDVDIVSRSKLSGEGQISSIAWASLVTHAAVSQGVPNDAALRSPSANEPDSPLQPLKRRSQIPNILRPGTPSASLNSRIAQLTFSSSSASSPEMPTSSSSEADATFVARSPKPDLRYAQSLRSAMISPRQDYITIPNMPGPT